MRLHTFIIFLGILVYITPFLGVPEYVRAYALFALGFLVVAAGLVVRHRAKKHAQKAEDITYVETIPDAYQEPRV
jgi:hypothetical protein